MNHCARKAAASARPQLRRLDQNTKSGVTRLSCAYAKPIRGHNKRNGAIPTRSDLLGGVIGLCSLGFQAW